MNIIGMRRGYSMHDYVVEFDDAEIALVETLTQQQIVNAVDGRSLDKRDFDNYFGGTAERRGDSRVYDVTVYVD